LTLGIDTPACVFSSSIWLLNFMALSMP